MSSIKKKLGGIVSGLMPPWCGFNSGCCLRNFSST